MQAAAGGPQLMSRPSPVQLNQFVMNYALFKATMRGQLGIPAMVALDKRLDAQLKTLQDDAVPALVNGLNFIARNDLGDC